MAQNTGTKSVDRPWKSIVAAADPDFEADKRREIEYDFKDSGGAGQGRTFATDRSRRWPYNQG